MDIKTKVARVVSANVRWQMAAESAKEARAKARWPPVQRLESMLESR